MVVLVSCVQIGLLIALHLCKLIRGPKVSLYTNYLIQQRITQHKPSALRALHLGWGDNVLLCVIF